VRAGMALTHAAPATRDDNSALPTTPPPPRHQLLNPKIPTHHTLAPTIHPSSPLPHHYQ
jgi:hypothetical protein